MLIPDNETSVDYLNHEAIAGTIVELLKDNRKRALTIGVHGDWGAGKSSILKMIETGLSGEEEVACLWFTRSGRTAKHGAKVRGGVALMLRPLAVSSDHSRLLPAPVSCNPRKPSHPAGQTGPPARTRNPASRPRPNTGRGEGRRLHA